MSTRELVAGFLPFRGVALHPHTPDERFLPPVIFANTFDDLSVEDVFPPRPDDAELLLQLAVVAAGIFVVVLLVDCGKNASAVFCMLAGSGNSMGHYRSH